MSDSDTKQIAQPLTEHQLHERWNKSVATLRRWRREGTGPSFMKLGKGILYPLSAVEEFEKKNTIKTGKK